MSKKKDAILMAITVAVTIALYDKAEGMVVKIGVFSGMALLYGAITAIDLTNKTRPLVYVLATVILGATFSYWVFMKG